MIRQALEKDIPRIVELAGQSLVDGPYKNMIGFNPPHAAKTAKQIIDGLGKILLWEENGEIAGLLGLLLIPHPYSGEPIATELMWYVQPEARNSGAGLKLLWEAEKVAKEFGATRMQVSGPNEQVGALYRRFGYELLEVAFVKELR